MTEASTDLLDVIFGPDDEEEGNELDEEDPCEEAVLNDFIYLAIILIMSLTLFLILTFTEKRAARCPGCCKGRGGILLSVNFLENKTNRSMIVAAFVLAAVEVIDAIFGMDDSGPMPKIVKVLLKGIMVGILNFIYLPLFHCVSENTLLRQCVGLFYAMTITCLALASETSVCPIAELSLQDLFQQVTYWLIIASAGTFLIYKFLHRIVTVTRRQLVTSVPSPVAKDPYQMAYIKNLLRKEISDEDAQKTGQLTQRLRRAIYVTTPGFRFSISILTSIIIGVLLFVIVISSSVGLAVDMYRSLAFILDVHRHELNETMPNVVIEIIKLVQGYNEENDLKEISIADFLDTQLTVFCAAFFIALAGAIVQVFCTVVFMLKAYRTNVIAMYRREFDDSAIQSMDNVSLVVSAVQFAGYQIAHMIWGYALQLTLFFVLFLLFTEIVVIPVLFGYWGVILAIINWLIPFILIMALTKGTQKLLVKYAFLVDRGKMFGIENRKCFYNMMFFMFFYNIFTGLISCIMRVIKATILGVWFFPRLDKSVFPHRFEKFDSGFRAYICLLRLEERQNNVVLLTFVQLLTEQCCRQIEEAKTEDVNMVEQRSPAVTTAKRKRARNRWFLAYTLMNNKTLQSARRGSTVIATFHITV